MPTLLFNRQEMQFYQQQEGEYQCPRCAARIKDWNGGEPRCGFHADGSFRKDNWNCATLIALRYQEDANATRCDDYTIATLVKCDVGFGMLKWYKSRGKTEDFRDECFEPGTLKLAQKLLGDISTDIENENNQWLFVDIDGGET